MTIDLHGISQDAADLIINEETGGETYYSATEFILTGLEARQASPSARATIVVMRRPMKSSPIGPDGFLPMPSPRSNPSLAYTARQPNHMLENCIG